MTSIEIGLALAACAGAAGWLLWWTWRRRLRELRELVARIASDEISNVPASLPRSGLFGAVYRELDRMAARIAELDRQISDDHLNLRAILSSMVEGVLIVDGAQRIRMANEGLERMFRFSRSPMNRSIIEVFRNHDLQEAIAQALETQDPQTREVSIEALVDGSYAPKHFQVTAVALTPANKGKAVGAIAVFHDITRVKQLEALRREFVANVSHELRTPLSIINGYIETLLDGALDDRESAERFLRVMGRHGQRLNLLIEDLLTLSKLESGAPGLRLERIDVRECTKRVVEQLERNLEQKSVKVDLQFTDEVTHVEADELRLEQAIFNLLDNAIKHGSRENPALRISTIRQEDQLCLSIEDNGPGIPLGDQPHIFERFYRVHKDRTREAGGTGLGLSIVKHIAQAHGGSVSVTSTSGVGSTFHLKLPLREDRE